MDFPDVDPDARKLSRDVPTPKTRTLGLTPDIFFRVEPRETPKHVFGDPQDINIDGRAERRQIKKYHFFECDIKRDERAKRDKKRSR